MSGSPTAVEGGAGKEYDFEHMATAGAESPKGTWALSL